MRGVLEVGIRASLSPLGCHKGLFASLPDYSPCAVKGEKKSDLCYHCKSYRPLELIEMYVLERETQPAAPSIVPSNSFKAELSESGSYLIGWPGLLSYRVKARTASQVCWELTCFPG